MEYNKTCSNNHGNNRGIFNKDYNYCPYCGGKLIPRTIVSENKEKYCKKKKCEHFVCNGGSLQHCDKYMHSYFNRELGIGNKTICGQYNKNAILKER